MRILYGVVGEGMGHATRSRVILNHLVKSHDVEIVVSGHAHAYLKKYFPTVHEIAGLRLSYDENEVRLSRTILKFFMGLPFMVRRNFDQFVKIGEAFRPDVVISDFESFAYTFGRQAELPVISIDNMQIINRCELDIDVPRDQKRDYRAAKTLIQGKLPGCYHYLITTFFFPPVRKERTSLFPPILRDKILDAPRSSGDHLLVYQTTTSNEALLEILAAADVPCRVYGFRREETIGKLVLRDFSEDGFIADLASCRGVLATGGFSLMGEAVYLGKPMLAVPVGKQFEQSLNALYLEKLGYGEYHRRLTVDAVRHFLGNLERYRENLSHYQQDRNNAILGKLDELLDQVEERSRDIE